MTLNSNIYLYSGSINLNSGILEVNGEIYQYGGTVWINKGKMTVTDGYYMTGNSQFIMQDNADYVLVNKILKIDSTNSSTGYLSAGVLEVKGDIIQYRSTVQSRQSSFCQNGTFKLVISSEQVSKVSIQSYDYSTFNIIDISSSAGVTFNSIITAKEIIGLNKVVGDLSLKNMNLKLDNDVNLKGKLTLINCKVNLNKHTLIVNKDVKLNNSQLDLSDS